MKKILSLGLVFLSASAFAMQLDIVRVEEKAATVKSLLKKTHIDQKSVFIPNRLGDVDLFHDKKGFCVYKDDTKHRIQKYHVDKMVRDISKEQLQAFLAVGYVTLNQMDNGEYSLRANGRIDGGGPILGVAMYWITKSICYAIPLAAIGTITVATGGAVGAAVGAGTAGAGLAVTGTAAATTVGATVGTTAGVATAGAATAAAVSGGATVVAGAITTAGLATEAAVVTAAGVAVASGSGVAATVGTGAAIVVGIETVSTAVGTFFGMLPTP